MRRLSVIGVVLMGVGLGPAPAALAAGVVHQHHTPNAFVVLVLVALGLLYIAWRRGRIKPLRSRHWALNWRAELRESGINPRSLIPLAVLVIVVLVLLLSH